MNIGRRLAAPAAAFLLLLATAPLALAQTTWPQEIADPEGTIVVYQPQPETLKGNVLTGRASVQRNAQQAKATRGQANNVLADRDGNVARKSKEGWESREGSKWQNADPSAARTKAQGVDRSAAQAKAQNADRSTVQRDYQARERGAQREATQRQVPRSQPSSRPATRPSSAPASRPTSRPSGARPR